MILLENGRMKRAVLVTVCAVLGGGAAFADDAASGGALKWTALPAVPAASGKTVQPGLAGVFAGVHNGVMILAGGANFPDGWPRDADGEITPKVYHRDIYVLTKADDDYVWRRAEVRLEHGYSYGVSIPTDDGLVCIGGEWKEPFVTDPVSGKSVQPHHLSNKVFVLKWDDQAKRVEITDKLVGDDDDAKAVLPLPPLPKPCAYIAGGMIGNEIYIAGGNCGGRLEATKNFWRLDLSKKTDREAFTWKSLPPWPGPPRWKAVAAVQSDGEFDCFYLFSGTGPRGLRLIDAWRFNPKVYERRGGGDIPFVSESLPPRKQVWRRLANVGAGAPGERCVAAAVAGAFGVNHILVVGGSDGEFYQRPEYRELAAAIADAKASGEADELARLEARMEQLMVTHPGFRRDVLAYHTITDTWVEAGQFPTDSHVTTTAVRWGDDLVIPGGEVRPGVRSANVWKASPHVPGRFGVVNTIVLGVYMASLVAMGFYFAKREKTTDDFFRAGRRIPWWAAGLSVFGTMLSAITFMAIPAKLYATNWLYLSSVIGIFIIVPIVTRAFIPFYRRLDVTTAYEYLEKRFNVAVRLFGSATFLLMQFGRIGIVLLLPSIALSVVTGINVYLCIAVMGVLSTTYTVLGGMEAVIWTDVVQVIVLMAGAIICLVLIVAHVPGGVAELHSVALENGKLEWADFSLDFTTATVWVLLLAIPGGLVPYASDQAVIQRYLTTKDEAAAAKGLWLCAGLGLIAMVFWALGTALYGFYKAHPSQLSPALSKSEMILPWYIVNELPAGVAGLVIAGVFAASMSSLDSSMNSMSAAVVTDFYRRFRTNASEAACLKLAKVVTALVGVAGTAFALSMAETNIKSIWDQFSAILGLFGGSLAGLFMLGMFTRRGTGPGALAGLGGGAIILYFVSNHTELHFFLYGVIGMASCVVIGYLVSLLTPRESPPGLTVYDMAKLNAPKDTPPQ